MLLLLLALQSPAPAPTPKEEDPLAKHTRYVVERVAAFSHPVERIRAMGRVGVIVCKRDHAEGVRVFERAAESVKLLEQDTPLVATDKPTREQLQAQSLRMSLRTGFLEQASRCDTAMAKRLLPVSAGQKETSPAEAAIASMRAAGRIITNGGDMSEGVQKADEAVQLGLTDKPNQSLSLMMSLLLQLQRTDPAAASKLFESALAQLVSRPQIDGGDWLALGIFLFATSPEGVSQSRGVSAGVFVPIFSVARTSAPPALIAEYLNAAISKLSQPPSTPEETQYVMAAAKQLLPLAQQLLPDRAAAFDDAMKVLAANSPPVDTSHDSHPRPSDGDDSDALDKVMALPGSDERDQKLMDLMTGAAMKTKWLPARDLAEKLTASALRTDALKFINYSEGIQFVKDNKLTEAQADASRMPPSSERCYLLLVIAKASIAFSANVNTCLQELPKTEPEEMPWIRLAAAEILAKTDVKSALALLHQTVADFNKLSADGKPNGTRNRTLGRMMYSLQTPGITQSLAPALALLMKSDAAATEATVAILQDEALLGQALAAVLEARYQASPISRTA